MQSRHVSGESLGLAVGPAFWSRSATELMAAFGTDARGLTSEEARAHLKRWGPNTVADEARLPALKLLLRQFESPLVLILIFGALVSLVLREWIDAAIILGIVIASTALGFSQEYRASAAVAALRRRLALTARVLRDGAEQTVLARSIVPGDVVLLAAGNLVPADGLVIEAKDFLVSEASLTGESFPVEKQPAILAPDTPLAGRTNSVFLGTSVRSGTARVIVVRTGRATAFGDVASHLKMRAPETEFARGIRQFGYLLLRIMIVMVLFVLTVNLLVGRPTIDSLLFAVALAVGMSPELLPAIVSVTLSAGARAMARRHVIVRRLEAIENLGSIDILCTDKTGTLTEGVIELSGAVDPEGRPSPPVRRLAYLNAAYETGIENPLDAAIVATGTSEGLSTAGWRKFDEIPYDFLRKRLTIVVGEESRAGTHLIITKGAFTNVLASCTAVARSDGIGPLDGETRDRLDACYRRMGMEGFRVIAVATRRVAAKARYDRDDEREMTFEGFLSFVDPTKPDAGQTIRDLASLGVKVKVISGDNRFVTAHVAKAIGLDPASMLTGEEIAKLKDEALWHLAERTDLFVEVDPQQKERLVRALQRTGHVVGYMGDGINDAPALHAADVGISVDQAVDVARESADIILLRRDLAVLRSGVEDGRRTFANTLKYISITTSANFGNMVSMAIATLFLPFLPLAAKQILLNNFLSDLPSIAISTDRVDASRIASSQRWSIRSVRAFMIVFGLLSTVFDLLTFAVLRYGFEAGEAVFQTAWFVVSLLTELAVVLVLRTQLSAYRSMPSRLLLLTTAGVAALTFAIPYAGPAAAAFDFVPLPGYLLTALVLIVAAYLVSTEIAKRRLFRQHVSAADHP